MSVVTALIRKHTWQSLNIRRLLQRQSAFKVAFVLVFASLFEGGLCLLFLDAFRFIDALGGIGVMILSRLFSLFFMGIGAMLVASGIVTSYSTVFRSEEMPFLFARPFSYAQVALYKFVESTMFSSWAFFFIIVPFVWAYGWHERLSPMFAFWVFLFSVPFLAICSGIGTLLTMIFVRWAPSFRQLKYIVLLAIAVAAYLGWKESLHMYHESVDEQLTITSLAPGFRLSTNPLLPSWWMSEGVLSLTNHQWLRGFMLLNVMLSSALAVVLMVAALGRWIFYDAWLRTTSGSGATARTPVLLSWLDTTWPFAAPQTRAIVMKDLRVFLRDPMQWSQVLIFFGLLALYFANIRQFRYHLLPDTWRNMICFLNIFSVSSVMCSLGSRFIYPQLSLEGHGFWIIGLAPTTMNRVLRTKFFFSLAGMLVISTTLMILSTIMMEAPPMMLPVALAVAVAVSFAVAALSTGLGAVFLDLKQRNPAAIVSGFGGTLNLVLCLAFMIAAILPFGALFHLSINNHLSNQHFHAGLAVSGVWLALITFTATYLPLRIGARTLTRTEF